MTRDHAHERRVAVWCAVLCLLCIPLAQLFVPQEVPEPRTCPPCVTRVETRIAPGTPVVWTDCDGVRGVTIPPRWRVWDAPIEVGE